MLEMPYIFVCIFLVSSAKTVKTMKTTLGFSALFWIVPEVIDYNQRKYEIEIVEACEATTI